MKKASARSSTARFMMVFVGIVSVLFVVELTQFAQANLVLPWTNALIVMSSGLISPFDDHVIILGKILQSTRNGFAISVEPGCNGVEAAIILIAAMLAFPAPWRHRTVGIAVGLAAVQALNIVRIITLFYLGQWSMRAFDWAHLYVWQVLIMLDVLIVWLVWIRKLPAWPPGRGPHPDLSIAVGNGTSS